MSTSRKASRDVSHPLDGGQPRALGPCSTTKDAEGRRDFCVKWTQPKNSALSALSALSAVKLALAKLALECCHGGFD